jgi:hypothetical protein
MLAQLYKAICGAPQGFTAYPSLQDRHYIYEQHFWLKSFRERGA